MIKNNQKLLNRFHVLLDGFIIVLSILIAYDIRFQSFIVNKYEFLKPNLYYTNIDVILKLAIYIVPAYLIFYYMKKRR